MEALTVGVGRQTDARFSYMREGERRKQREFRGDIWLLFLPYCGCWVPLLWAENVASLLRSGRTHASSCFQSVSKCLGTAGMCTPVCLYVQDTGHQIAPGKHATAVR